MKRSTFTGINRTSVLRLIPAFLVAFVPLQMLDKALLKSLYALRGPIPPSSQIRLFVTQEAREIEKLNAYVAHETPSSCWILSPQSFTGPCKTLSLKDRYTEKSLEKVTPLNPQQTPLFFGPLQHLPSTHLGLALARPQGQLEPLTHWIVLDTRYHPKIPIPTASGPLDQGEWLLNTLLSHLEEKYFHPAPTWLRWAFPLLVALVTALVLYSYPILLSLLFITLLAALIFAITFWVFENWGLQLPLATSWTSMLTVVLLGMGDRLDRRERREWALEYEAENRRSLDEMRNNFLSLVSHDLKTPIAKILSLLHRFARGEFGEVSSVQKAQLESMASTSGYLQRTISTLLLLSRIESKDFRIHRKPTDLTQLLLTAARQHQPLAHERKLVLVTDVEPLFLVDLDENLISQVINNLLENAIRYSPGDTTLTLRCRESDNCVELSPPQPGVWFEIQDEGPGIPFEDRRRVLQKFVRGSSENTSTDQSVKGTGLGLYLSNFFVQKHGGCLTLISKTPEEEPLPGSPAHEYFPPHGSGTVVRITLPFSAPLFENPA